MNDIKMSIIIPTLNRVKDLRITLDSIMACDYYPCELIIVDQSDDDDTKKLVLSDTYKKLNIQYRRIKIKSLTHARNEGIKFISKKTKYVIFFDDDVSVECNYFKNIDNFFEVHTSAKGGMANMHTPSRTINFFKYMGIFLLSGETRFDKMYVTKGGFNVLPLNNPYVIKNIEWISCGAGFFRREIFDEGFRFENRFLKYCLMEDVFFSYSIFKKYPGSLYFVPNIKLIHREAPSSRIANKQRIYQNIIHRYYFIKKFNKSFCAYLWTMIIFSIFDFMQYKTFKVFLWYIKGLNYVNQNKDYILNPTFDFNEFIFG